MKGIDNEKINRYIKGIPDECDKEYMDSLFAPGENSQYLKDALEDDWENFKEETTTEKVDLASILDSIHHTIRLSEYRKKNKTIIRIFETYRKLAAILLIPLIIASGFLLVYFSSKQISPQISQNSTFRIYAPLGSRINFNLPDGTKGMLNSGSYLSYSMPFTKRDVQLEGEAWFEVFHDEAHPFTIAAGSSEVRVLGTSFNLSAYPSENYVEVVLLSGKVEFSDSKLKNTISITPSQRLVFHEGSVDTTLTDPLKYNAWTTGKLVFRGDPMTEVARRIERWYNVKVILADKELEKYSFRGTFLDDKLETVLRFLSQTSPITYHITPQEQLPDGTVNTQIVTIFLKK